MAKFASRHTSAQKTAAALKTIRTDSTQLGNFCVIVLKATGEAVPGFSLFSKDASGRAAQNQAKATLRKLHGAQKKFGLSFGLITANDAGKVTFHVLKMSSVAEDELRRGLRGLSHYSDLNILKSVEISSGQTREELLSQQLRAGRITAAEIEALLRDAGMESDEERAHYLDLLQQDPPQLDQLDVLGDLDVSARAFEEELQEQNRLLEEYPTATPARQAEIIRTLSAAEHIGESLPKAGHVPRLVRVMLNHIAAVFKNSPSDDPFAALDDFRL